MSDERDAPGAAMGSLPRGIGPADWSIWGALPAVRLSQALLLSIGGEPDDWSETIQEVGQTLLERRRIALSHLRAGRLPLLERDDARPIESTISLAEFGNWARRLGWQLPSELPGAAPIVNASDLTEATRHIDDNDWQTPIRFGDLAHRIAKLKYPNDLTRYGFARLELESELAEAALRGELKVRNALTGGTLRDPHPGGEVFIDDLRPFLAERGMSIPECAPEKPARVKHAASDGRDDGEAWKAMARAEAQEYIEGQRRNGWYPNQILIAEKIAKDFRERGIVGPDKKPLSASYIKRHALKGITSGAAERRTASKRRGK